MKKLKLSFLLLSIAFVLCSCAGGSGETVATVNNAEITSGEVLFMMAQGMKNIKISEAELRENSIETLIDYSLLSLKAQKEKITVSDSEVKSRMEGIFSDAELNKMKKNYGVSRDAVKRVVKKQILHQKYVMEILGNSKDFIPTEEQLLDSFYSNYYKAQHILIDTKNMSSADKEEAREELEKVLRRIEREEELFGKYVLEISDDTSIFVFKEREIEQELFEAVKSLGFDEISEIVETPMGLHIIKRLPLMNSDMASKEVELVNNYKKNYIEAIVDELKKEYGVNIDNAKLKEITVSTGF